MREKCCAFVAPPRTFPLSIWATFTREHQISPQNYTPVSTEPASGQEPKKERDKFFGHWVGRAVVVLGLDIPPLQNTVSEEIRPRAFFPLFLWAPFFRTRPRGTRTRPSHHIWRCHRRSKFRMQAISVTAAVLGNRKSVTVSDSHSIQWFLVQEDSFLG